MLEVLQDPVVLTLLGLGIVAILMITFITGGMDALIFGCMGLAAFFVTHVSVRLGPILLADIFFVGSALPIIIRALSLPLQQSTVKAFLPILGLLALLLLGGLLGTFFSEAPGLSIASLSRFTLASVAMMGLFLLWSPTDRQTKFLLRCFVWGAAVSAAFGFAIRSSNISGARWIGLAGHPNHLGETSFLAVGITLAFLYSTRSTRGRVFHLAIVATLATAVLLSGSRGSLLALGITVSLFLVCSGHWKSFGVVSVAGMAALQIVNPFERVGLAASNAARMQLLRERLSSLEDQAFLGAGFGNARYSHSLYLDIWSSAGLLGIVFLVGFVLLIIRKLMSARIRLDYFGIGMASAFVGQLIASMFSPVIWDRYFWMYLALLLMVSCRTRSQIADSRNSFVHSTRLKSVAPD